MIRTIRRGFHRTRTLLAGVRTPTRVRPDDALEAHASGPDPIRVLLAGGDILTGWGVRTHHLALPGHLARALAAHTGRGVDVTIALDPAVTTATLLPLIRPHRLDTYDAVVLHLGLADVQRCTSPTRWTTNLHAGILFLCEHLRDDATITIVGVPQPSTVPYLHAAPGGVLDRHAARLNEATHQLCTSSNILFVAAPVYVPQPGSGEHVGRPDHYLHWARQEADHLAQHLPHRDDHTRDVRREPFCPTADTDRRMRALRSLTWDTNTDTAITHIVTQALSLFGVDTVTFAVATTDELVQYIHVGNPVHNVPLSKSLCWNTLQQLDTRIVPDIRTENEQFGRYPARFYASHPVFAPDGTPIGTLSLLAATPPPDEVNVVLLRDLALHIQEALAQPTTRQRENTMPMARAS